MTEYYGDSGRGRWRYQLDRPLPARRGWSRRWLALLDATRFIGTALLYMGCLLEIIVGTVIAYVVLNPGGRP